MNSSSEHKRTLKLVSHLGAQVCEATAVGDFQKGRKLRLQIHRLLREEQRERPKLSPGILRVKAAWCSRKVEERRLLERSYLLAQLDGDSFQMGFSAAALSDYHSKRPKQQNVAIKWLRVAERLYHIIPDRELRREVKRLSAILKEPER